MDEEDLREISAYDWHRIELWRRGLMDPKDGTAILAVGDKWIRFERVRINTDGGVK